MLLLGGYWRRHAKALKESRANGNRRGHGRSALLEDSPRTDRCRASPCATLWRDDDRRGRTGRTVEDVPVAGGSGRRRARHRRLDRGRRDGRAAGPQRRRQVDDDRHAARPRETRRRQRVGVRPRRRRRPSPPGAVGAMLQTGGADPRPHRPRAGRDDRLALPGAARRRRGARARPASATSPGGAPRSSPAARRSACASRSRS